MFQASLRKRLTWLGPVLGMKINMLLKFPQAGFKKEDVADICAKLDALDA